MSETRTSLKKAPEGEQALGPLVIVKPSKLAAEGITGVVAKGVFEGAVRKGAGISASGKAYKASTEYRIRDMATNTLYILNETTALKEQLGELAADGSDKVNVEVIYNGKKATKNGNDYHDFEVFTVA
jgi:hypothetical protein